VKATFIAQSGANLLQLQQEIAKVFDQLGVICVGELIENVTIGTSSTAVPHNLKSIPMAVIPAIGSVGATILLAAPSTSTNVYLQASAPLTVSIWVM
jgi:hypothetical protein